CVFSYNAVPSYTYALPLHDALPICLDALHVRTVQRGCERVLLAEPRVVADAPQAIDLGPGRAERRLGQEPRRFGIGVGAFRGGRSEEHTSELQSRENLVCRLPLEKK